MESEQRKQPQIKFDRHTPEFRERLQQLPRRCTSDVPSPGTARTADIGLPPDYRCDPERTVHYDTIGVIEGMQHLPATFSPGQQSGAGLDETLDKLQRICERQGLARPITEFKGQARID